MKLRNTFFQLFNMVENITMPIIKIGLMKAGVDIHSILLKNPVYHIYDLFY